MGLIREPEGVDFVINSRPLTKKEQEALSKFIKEDKAQRLLSKGRTVGKNASSKKKARA